MVSQLNDITSGIHNIANGKNGAPLKMSFLFKNGDIPASHVSFTEGKHIQPLSPSNLWPFCHNKEIFASDPTRNASGNNTTSLSGWYWEICGLVRAILIRNDEFMNDEIIGIIIGLKYSLASFKLEHLSLLKYSLSKFASQLLNVETPRWYLQELPWRTCHTNPWRNFHDSKSDSLQNQQMAVVYK